MQELDASGVPLRVAPKGGLTIQAAPHHQGVTVRKSQMLSQGCLRSHSHREASGVHGLRAAPHHVLTGHAAQSLAPSPPICLCADNPRQGRMTGIRRYRIRLAARSGRLCRQLAPTDGHQRQSGCQLRNPRGGFEFRNCAGNAASTFAEEESYRAKFAF